jgi:predicted TIM-barrel fold metal-dependent hydrolase
MLDGEPIWQNMSDRSRAEMLTRGARRIEELHAGGRPELQLREMDRAGIDIAFFYPTVAHFVLAINDLDPRVARAYASAYNDWLRGFCSLDPRRLRGVGVLARQDIPGMSEELRRVAGFGFRTVVLRPNPIGGKTLGHPAYEPFWAECERMAMSVAVHEGTHARAPSAGADRFTSRFALHACSHPMEQMMAFLALLEGGVLERHPGLRFAFLEAGCGWIPYWLFRLDEYFRRQCFVAIEPGEPYIADMIKYIGEDNLLFGTDFPHLDHDTGIMDEGMALKASLPEAALRKILWDNPVRFYGVGS